MLNIARIRAEYQQLSRPYNTNEQCDGSNDTALKAVFFKDKLRTLSFKIGSKLLLLE